MPAVAAVIVAGGQGTRFGGNVRKQYLTLKGKPLLWWSLYAFERARSIGTMVVVVPGDDVERVRVQSRRWGFKKLTLVTGGGKTRQDSVRKGVSAIGPRYRWIAIHDAVRPLVSPGVIEAVIAGARPTGAAIAAIPSRDTVKISGPGGFIRSTPKRTDVWLAQTPQVIRLDLFERAHRKSKNFLGTDDAQLVERLGIRVKLVMASVENIKVTVPADLVIAKQLI